VKKFKTSPGFPSVRDPTKPQTMRLRVEVGHYPMLTN
jgi:hypothetical protein